MDKQEIDVVAGLLKAMAHPIRLQILCLLSEEELPVCEIQREIQTTNGNISQHLNILRNQGIISCRKEANFVFNRITDPRVLHLVAGLRSLFTCDPPA